MSLDTCKRIHWLSPGFNDSILGEKPLFSISFVFTLDNLFLFLFTLNIFICTHQYVYTALYSERRVFYSIPRGYAYIIKKQHTNWYIFTKFVHLTNILIENVDVFFSSSINELYTIFYRIFL